MELRIVEGDLLAQDVEVIVNTWNRNIIPWWLLIPQGVSGAIKRSAGLEPFQELARKGIIPLGSAVETNSGKLSFRSIIHVAGINMFWRSSEKTIRNCVRSTLALAKNKGYRSLAFPLIGSGSGGFSSEKSLEIMKDEISHSNFNGEIRIVRFAVNSVLINERVCYCGLWEKDPKFYESRGVPRGYCGFCIKCGKPGHTRHFPGAVPFTGCWCDFHYRLISLIHPLGFPGTLIYVSLIAGGIILWEILKR